MTSFKMLLFLLFLYLIKYSQRNVNMSHYNYIFFLFPYIYSDFLLYLCLLLRCLMIYDVYHCELYLSSLEIFIISFKINLISLLEFSPALFFVCFLF